MDYSALSLSRTIAESPYPAALKLPFTITPADTLDALVSNGILNVMKDPYEPQPHLPNYKIQPRRNPAIPSANQLLPARAAEWISGRPRSVRNKRGIAFMNPPRRLRIKGWPPHSLT